MSRKYKYQPPVKGGRTPMYSGISRQSEEEINRLQRIYGVSRSWVISTIVNDSLHVKGQPRYYDVKPSHIRRVK